MLPLGRNEKLFLEVTSQGAFEPEVGSLAIRATAEPQPTTSARSDGRSSRPILEARVPGWWRKKGSGRLFACGRRARCRLRKRCKIVRPTARRLELEPNPDDRGRLQLRPARPCGSPCAPGAPLRGPPLLRGRGTHGFDFSTAHGAHDSGRRAAEEAFAYFESASSVRGQSVRPPASSPDRATAGGAPALRWRRRWRCPAPAPAPGRRVRPCRSADCPTG